MSNAFILLKAIEDGHLEQVEKFLKALSTAESQAILNTNHGQNQNPQSRLIAAEIPSKALHCAVFNNDLQMVQLLLAHGANPHEEYDDNLSALQVALETIHLDTDTLQEKLAIIDLLCLHGATLEEDALDKQIGFMVELLASTPPNPKAIAFQKAILERVCFENIFLDFIEAALVNREEETQRLIKEPQILEHPYTGQPLCSIRLDAIRNKEHPYYGLAVLKTCNGGLLGLEHLKLFHEACDIALDARDINGNNALHYAVRFLDNTAVLKYLLSSRDSRSLLDAKNKGGQTALDLATQWHFFEAVECLLAAGPSPDTFNQAQKLTQAFYIHEHMRLLFEQYKSRNGEGNSRVPSLLWHSAKALAQQPEWRAKPLREIIDTEEYPHLKTMLKFARKTATNDDGYPIDTEEPLLKKRRM